MAFAPVTPSMKLRGPVGERVLSFVNTLCHGTFIPLARHFARHSALW